MLEDKKIEDLIKSNPEVLVEFNRNHGSLLADLRLRFQLLISTGNMIERYLLTRALFETIDIQGKVAKEHIKQQAREMGVNIVDGGTSEH